MDDQARQTTLCPDDILSQCATLMARQGYHGTSMRDLARTTGRSLSGLYHYFSNKEELLFLINQRGFPSLLENGERLRAAYREAVSEVPDKAPMSSAHGEIIRQLKDRYGRIMHFAVDQYMQAHGHKAEQIEIERKTYLLFGMLNWIFGWYSYDEHGSVEMLAQDVFATFTQGCLAGKDQGNNHD